VSEKKKTACDRPLNNSIIAGIADGEDINYLCLALQKFLHIASLAATSILIKVAPKNVWHSRRWKKRASGTLTSGGLLGIAGN
jgi:hypothetical protein